MQRDYAFYVALQAEGGDPDMDVGRFEQVLAEAMEKRMIVDAVLPKSEAEVRAIWNIREDFESILEPEPVYLYDVSLPIREMARYVDEVRANVRARWPVGECYTLGHVADGNLHFFVQPNVTGDLHAASDECVYTPLARIGGSVSAEHGLAPRSSTGFLTVGRRLRLISCGLLN